MSIVVLFSCGIVSTSSPVSSGPTDYSRKSNWAMIAERPDLDADIFYLHPTTYYDTSENASDNWQITDSGDAADIVYATLVSQVSIFKGIANPYVPYYKQMNIGVSFKKDNEKASKISYDDVKAAFLYYYRHYNKGKPFFIYGHSQGAHFALRLMEDIFSDSKYSDKLIAAYLVGWPVTQQTIKDFPHIKVLETATSFGGVVPWDVVAENVTYVLPTVAPNSIIVNPITWTTSKEPISKKLNLGAAFYEITTFDYKKTSTIAEFTGGQIKEMPAIPGVIESSYTAFVTPDLTEAIEAIEGKISEKETAAGCYHIIANDLFYENIRKNVRDRKEAYLKAFK